MRKRIIIALAIVAAVVATVVFAQSDGGDDNTKPETVFGTSQAAERMSAQEVVQMLIEDGMSVTSTTPNTGTYPYVADSVDIMFLDDVQEAQGNGGDGVADQVEAGVHTFASLEDRDAWLDVSESLGGYAVTRDDELWVVSVDSDLPDSPEIAQRLADDLDGAELVG